MPFDNTIVVVRMTGAQLRAALDFGLGRERVSPLEVSGLTASFRRTEAGGTANVEWVSVTVGGTPLDDAKTYRVAVNSFLAGGGDGYRVFTAPGAKDTGIVLRDAIREHFARSPTYQPDTTSRLVQVK
jgi:5'-nucleotidase